MPEVYDYIPEAGSLYARSFALYEDLPAEWRLFYYDPGEDCTNFISQCVWAAYGGWIPGFMSEIRQQNEKRILKDIRQVKGIWYGSKNNIGSEKWCRVIDFYRFATHSDKKFGPRAVMSAEGRWDNVDPRIIRQGDIVQLVVADYAPERFGHSLYVTKPGNSWDDILICCHTVNRLDEPMSGFSQNPEVYKKLRILRFFPAEFEN